MYMRRVRHLVLPTLLTGVAGSAVVGGLADRAVAAGMSNVLGASNINPSYYLTSLDSVNEAANQLVGMGAGAVKLEMDTEDLNQTFSASSKYAWNTPAW